MLFFEEIEGGIKDVTLDEDTKRSVMEELKQYQIVYTRIITWEKLDEDREGETIDKKLYPLGDDDCPLDIHALVKDGEFIGVGIFYTSTTSWNAGLNKRKELGGCTLYKDGRVKGSAVNTSSYDSPNNHDDVSITYSLRKI